MFLKSLIESEQENYDAKADNSVAKKSDTRKTRLTLEQINKLRRLNDLKITEYNKTIAQVKKQYAAPKEEAAPSF